MGWTNTRSKIANTVQRDPLADVTDLRRQLRVERLEEQIRKAVDTAPPLTTQQRMHLCSLLVGGDTA